MRSLTLSAVALSILVAGFSGAYAQVRTTPAGKLFFEGDIVRHALEGQQGPFCVLQNQYKRGEAVAWRIRVQKPDGTPADQQLPQERRGPARQRTEAAGALRRSRHAADGFLLVAVLDDPRKLPDGLARLQGQRHHAGRQRGVWEPFTRATTQLMVIAGDPVMAPANNKKQ